MENEKFLLLGRVPGESWKTAMLGTADEIAAIIGRSNNDGISEFSVYRTIFPELTPCRIDVDRLLHRLNLYDRYDNLIAYGDYNREYDAKQGTFVSVWDGGDTIIGTKCSINMHTGEVFDIEYAGEEALALVDICEKEFVEIEGQMYPITYDKYNTPYVDISKYEWLKK